MILVYLLWGIFNSILVGRLASSRPSWRRVFNIIMGVALVGTFAALMVLVFGPPHVDRSEPWIQGLGRGAVIWIGYLVDATGMLSAATRQVKRLVGLNTDEEPAEVEPAGGDDGAESREDEPEDDENRKE